MSLLRGVYAHFHGLNPGMVGLEDCESLYTDLNPQKVAAEEHLVRYFLSTQQALEHRALGDAYRSPGAENPADGFTGVSSDMAPLSWIPESCRFNPDSLRPLRGVSSRGGHGRV